MWKSGFFCNVGNVQKSDSTKWSWNKSSSSFCSSNLVTLASHAVHHACFSSVLLLLVHKKTLIIFPLTELRLEATHRAKISSLESKGSSYFLCIYINREKEITPANKSDYFKIYFTLTVLTSCPSRYSAAVLFFSMPLLMTRTRWCHWPSAMSSPQRKRAQQGRIS